MVDLSAIAVESLSNTNIAAAVSKEVDSTTDGSKAPLISRGALEAKKLNTSNQGDADLLCILWRASVAVRCGAKKNQVLSFNPLPLKYLDII